MIRDLVHTAYQSVLDIIAQPLSPSCLTFMDKQTYLCIPCWHKIRPIAPIDLEITQTTSATVYVVGAYEGPLKKLILKKNNRTRAIAISATLGHCVWNYSIIKNIPFDLIVPIPLHWTRHVWRGFNQAEEMAAVIAQQSNKTIVHALKRTRKTKFQAECSKEARTENIKGALSLVVDAQLIRGKTILLIDDLVTTGATIKAASALLYAAKAERVIVAAVCRT